MKQQNLIKRFYCPKRIKSRLKNKQLIFIRSALKALANYLNKETIWRGTYNGS